MNSSSSTIRQNAASRTRWQSLRVIAECLLALVLVLSSTAVARWWPAGSGDYSSVIKKQLRTIDGVAGESDAADEAVVRGTALLSKKQFTEAVREFEAAVAEQPAYPMAWLNLGVAYYQVGRTNDTLRAWLRAYAMDKFNGLVPYNLGLLHELQGQLRTAREYYQQAVRVDPANKDAVRAVERLKILDR